MIGRIRMTIGIGNSEHIDIMEDDGQPDNRYPILTSIKGIKYQIGEKLDWGYFECRRYYDKKVYIYRDMNACRSTKSYRDIKKSIITLMEELPYETFCIADMIDGEKLFGLVLESENDFIGVERLWNCNLYPDAVSWCKIGNNIAESLRALHLRGLICANGIEGGRVSVRLTDLAIHLRVYDTVSVGEAHNRYGTTGFCAPEWYKTHIWDVYTDYYATAVFFFRMLVGAFPLYGKKTKSYIEDNCISVFEAAPMIYGQMATFAFDPADESNTIRGVVDSQNPKLYGIQTKRWDALPEPLKECFFRTFSAGLKEEQKYLRTTDRQWIQAFKKAQIYTKKCPACGRLIFEKQIFCVCGYKGEL